MTQATPTRFELEHITPTEWVIRDRDCAESDPRSIAARIWQVDAHRFEVTWSRSFPLRRFYASPRDVLADVRASIPHATKPVPIPHRPPWTGFAQTG